MSSAAHCCSLPAAFERCWAGLGEHSEKLDQEEEECNLLGREEVQLLMTCMSVYVL